VILASDLNRTTITARVPRSDLKDEIQSIDLDCRFSAPVGG
jgi:hypothetical protein